MKLLADRQIIEVSGEDRTIFLQNLITNDLRDLSEKKISHTFILNHLGKIIFEFYIHYTSECLLLDCNYASADELIKKLMMYKLRSKIVLRSREDLSVYWEESKIIFPKDPRNNSIGSRKINVKKSITSQNDASNYDHFRIKLGIAEINKDFLPSDIFAHELNDYVNSISYTKGCYPGQEIVSRIYHKKATSKKIFYPFHCIHLPRKMGTKLFYQDKEIGFFGSNSDKLTLAFVNKNFANLNFYIDNSNLVKKELLNK